MNFYFQEEPVIQSYLNKITFQDLKPDFLCIKCGKIFQSEATLEDHMTGAHSFKQNTFTCVICFKNYEQRKQLVSHQLRVHDSSKKTQCSKCGKILCNKYSFLLHNKKFHPLMPSIN